MLLGRISRAKIMSALQTFLLGQELANSTEQSLFTITLFRYREQRPKLYLRMHCYENLFCGMF